MGSMICISPAVILPWESKLLLRRRSFCYGVETFYQSDGHSATGVETFYYSGVHSAMGSKIVITPTVILLRESNFFISPAVGSIYVCHIILM